jgi:hypothetical protein
MPTWLTIVAIGVLAIAIISALVIVADILAGHRQHMAVMNIVWPITALYAGPLALWAYFTIGRLSTTECMRQAKAHGEKPPSRRKPFWQSVGLAATHCGSGCTLGDLVAEWLIVLVPFTLFGRTLFAAWVVDFVLAFIFGIVFQYFTIAPMRHLSLKDGLVAALKADSLSLTSWQIGMYGWMAIAVFLIFGHELPKTDPVFWFMMQIAMLAGFLTSYPVNWWLVKQGLKENM